MKVALSSSSSPLWLATNNEVLSKSRASTNPRHSKIVKSRNSTSSSIHHKAQVTTNPLSSAFTSAASISVGLMGCSIENLASFDRLPSANIPKPEDIITNRRWDSLPPSNISAPPRKAHTVLGDMRFPDHLVHQHHADRYRKDTSSSESASDQSKEFEIQKGIGIESIATQKCFQPGDLLVFPRRHYHHWAIYLGMQEGVHYIIHRWNPSEQITKSTSSICISPLHHLHNWENVYLGNNWDSHLRPFEREEIIGRALSTLGTQGYNAFVNNCEHFATWARYGAKLSDQVHNKVAPALATLAGSSLFVANEAMSLLPSRHIVILAAAAVSFATVSVIGRWRRLRRQESKVDSNPVDASLGLDIRSLISRCPLCDGRREGIPEYH